jgi:hypothetical protein
MTDTTRDPDDQLPLLPYGPADDRTSGFAVGSPTSEARARHADEGGTTTKRQARVLGLLAEAGAHGRTWREVAAATGWHHGQVSGALSVLHKEGRIARLTQTRARCSVYVLPAYVGDRPTEAPGRQAPALTGPERTAVADVRAALDAEVAPDPYAVRVLLAAVARLANE